MNEIVITGSTGIIGRRAVEADVFDEASLRRAFDGADAVVNVLTHVPRADRMADAAAWAENDRVRTEASAAIARAAQAAGAKRLVQESIAFVYADGGRAAVSFLVSDGRITRIDAVRNPEKLQRL